MKQKVVLFVCGIVLVTFIFLAITFWFVYPLKYENYILEFSKEYSLSPSLVASVICVESRFETNVESRSGACGLMQLMPSTYSWVMSELNLSNNEGDIFNAKENIRAGCFYLNYLFDKYSNQQYVLACYNAGEGVVSSWGNSDNFSIDDIQYSETKNYVIKVLSLVRLYDSRLY